MIATLANATSEMQGASALGTMQDGAVQLGLRWIHLVAGVLWIGLLYFFNWVNATFAPTMDGETKKKVVPELMPRALYFFRWGAAWTWITGVLLIGLIYYHPGGAPLNSNFWDDLSNEGNGTGKSLVALVLVLALFPVYDAIAKALAKRPMLGIAVWFAVATGYAFLMQEWLHASERAIYIHVGGLLGTAMAANVWMRIWPCQKRIITAIKSGQAPNPADPALAGLRSKHNTYMSVPLLLLMVSVHQTWMTGLANPTRVLAAVFVLGFVATYWIFQKSTQVKGF